MEKYFYLKIACYKITGFLLLMLGLPFSMKGQIVNFPRPGSINTYRINAGGPAVTNSIGSFSEDQLYFPTPGEIYVVTDPIAGTTDDAIYQTERYSTTDYGSFSYDLPVPNGKYKVILHFAEIYWTNPAQRRFDVSIENKKVLDDYDMVERAGPLTAIVEKFAVTVTDGWLDINFSSALNEGGLDRPKVSAIEVLPLPADNKIPVANAGIDKYVMQPQSSVILSGSGSDSDGTIEEYKWSRVSGSGAITDATSATTSITGLTPGVSVFQLVVTDNAGAVSVADQVTITVSSTHLNAFRINAGGPSVTNSIGTFVADQLYAPSPGNVYSTTTPIAGTTDDALYQSERYASVNNGSFSYNIPVAPGIYTVTLHFAEIYWTAPGKRRFDVSIENTKVLDDYDIVQRAGPFTAIKEKFTINVNDGMLNIDFTAAISEGGIDRPKVSAIEVINAVELNPQLKIYPNPNINGKYWITTNKIFIDLTHYTLYSSTGILVKSGSLQLIDPTRPLAFDLSKEVKAAGMYYLHLAGKKYHVVLKLIKY